MACRLSAYASPVPNLPARPTNSKAQLAGDRECTTQDVQEESRRDGARMFVGERTNRISQEDSALPGAQKDVFDEWRTRTRHRQLQGEGWQRQAVSQDLHRSNSTNAPTDVLRVSEQFRNVLRFASDSRPDIDSAPEPHARPWPRFASLVGPERLESLPVSDKLYSNVHGDGECSIGKS